MNKKPLLVIFLIVFFDLVGFGMIVPILPYYAEAYGASGFQLGVLMACYSAMQFVFSPLWGRISDRYGRRPVLLFSTFGMGVSLLLLGWAPALPWLFAARLLGGIFGANISTAMAYVADVTTPDNRAKGMGMIGAAFGLGFLFGPAIGGSLSSSGYGTAGYVAGLLSLLNFCWAWFVLREPEVSAEDRALHRSKPTREIFKLALADPKTLRCFLMFFLVTMGIAQMETSFGLFLMDRFQLGARSAGYILAGMALVMVLIQGGGIGRLVKQFGELKLILTGALLMAVALVGASFSLSLKVLIAFLLVQALGYALTTPSLQSLTSRSASKHIQGSVMGVYHSAGSLARILGPLLAGWSYDYFGMSSPFFIASAFFLVVFFLLQTAKKIFLTSPTV